MLKNVHNTRLVEKKAYKFMQQKQTLMLAERERGNLPKLKAEQAGGSNNTKDNNMVTGDNVKLENVRNYVK